MMMFAVAELRVPLSVTLINLGYYVLVSIGMVGFYIVTATRIFFALFKRLKSSSFSSQSENGSRSSSSPRKSFSASKETALRSKLFDVTLKLSISAFCLLLVLLMAVLTFFPFYITPNSHPGYFAFWLVLHFILNLKSLSTILSFQPPTSQQRSTTRGAGTQEANSLHLSQFDSGLDKFSVANESLAVGVGSTASTS